MVLIVGILGLIIGIGLGYAVFYYRYEDTHSIDELRKNAKAYSQQINHLQADYDEFSQQNLLLKEKVTELMAKNDDLSKVVSDLSRYYYHIKQGIDKAKELLNIFGHVDPSMEHKITHYTTPKSPSSAIPPSMPVISSSPKKKNHMGFF